MQRLRRFGVEAEKGVASELAWDHTGSDESGTAVMAAEDQRDVSAGSCSDGAVEALQEKLRATCRCAGWGHFQLAAHILPRMQVGRCGKREAAAVPAHWLRRDANVAQSYDRTQDGSSTWGVEPNKVKAEDRV